jgi:hypothetical protein
VDLAYELKSNEMQGLDRKREHLLKFPFLHTLDGDPSTSGCGLSV